MSLCGLALLFGMLFLILSTWWPPSSFRTQHRLHSLWNHSWCPNPQSEGFFLYLPALPAQALPPLYCPDLSGCYVHLGPSLCPHQTKNSSRVGFSRITQPRRMHYKCFLNLCWDYFCLCVSVFAWACPSAWTAVPVSVHTACFETCHQVLLPLAPAPVYPSPNAHSSCPCTSLHHGLVAVWAQICLFHPTGSSSRPGTLLRGPSAQSMARNIGGSPWMMDPVCTKPRLVMLILYHLSASFPRSVSEALLCVSLETWRMRALLTPSTVH